MFQVVVQSAMRQLKAKLKLRAPPSNLGEEKTPQEKNKDRTGFILALAIGGTTIIISMLLHNIYFLI